MPLRREFRVPLLLLCVAFVTTCGGSKTPTQPTTPPPATPPPAPQVTVTSVQVGVAGQLPATVAPGDKLQLFAQAMQSDGSVIDATNIALWQSSNPIVATVSNTGLLSAFAEGALDVSASYQGRTGSLHADVAPAGCSVTLTPSSLVFGALATTSGVTVAVTASRSDCRWTAKSNAAWLPVSVDPGRSGSGSFGYNVPGNNNTSARDAEIVVSVAGGPAAVHHIHQERPVGCVYRVSPERLEFNAAGGAGSFAVTTVPGDCQWRITDTWSGVTMTSATSGTGAATVTYQVAPNTFGGFDRTLRVAGLSGLNPPAIHTIRVQ
jgi:hypothetical protein